MTGAINFRLTVVVAISSAALPKIYTFTVELKQGEGNLSRDGHVNCAQLLTLDQNRLEDRIGELSRDLMRKVDAALRYELDL